MACLLLSGLLTNPVYGQDRELASEGNQVTLNISESYNCAAEGTVIITTKSAGYFDLGAEVVERLSDTARAILGFECPNLTKIYFKGITEGTEVYSAQVSASSDWGLESDPAPLERLALFLTQHDPNYFHLGGLHDQLTKYDQITGIKDSYQYKFYDKEARRLMSILDDDASGFLDYIQNPKADFGGFENAAAHYQSILRTIKRYAPEKFSSYDGIYKNEEPTLKIKYWDALFALLSEDESLDIGEMVNKVKQKNNEKKSKKFTAFIDDKLATYIEDQANTLKFFIDDAFLDELSVIADFSNKIPQPSQATGLVKTKSLLTDLSESFPQLVLKRSNELQTLAKQQIKESGNTYNDVETILEAGFELAKEFESVGFEEEGVMIVTHTAEYIDQVLAGDLENFRNEISAQGDSIALSESLQEQSATFEELALQFEGFSAYKKVVDEKIEDGRHSICTRILEEAGVSSRHHDKRIFVNEGFVPLKSFACKLYENDHALNTFEWNWWPLKEYTLSITDVNGETSEYILESDSIFSATELKIKSKVDTSGETFDADDWREYLTHLVLPPPSGEPDGNGIRECDKLAADPLDPNKLTDGVDFEVAELSSFDFDRLVDSCVAAVENDPTDSRQLFQLGRALWSAGENGAADEYLSISASQNYGAAMFLKAQLLLENSEDPDAFIDALDLYEGAAKAGYKRGADMVKELNPDGIDFYKEIPQPTSKELLGALPSTREERSAFGITASNETVDIDLRSCFQTSATDFSCEFKKIIKCSLDSRSNDPFFRFLSALAQRDCDNAYPEFSTFRKLSEGKWKQVPDR